MNAKPNLNFWKLWSISFGYFGVQAAYALQNANISRIFTTLGADPHHLSYFWILPPLAGTIVQPIIGIMSDKTWTRFGRRMPYLFLGSLISVLVMCLLPNSGSFGMSSALIMPFAVTSLLLLGISINMATQPFKMLVGDMVNEKQKDLAFSLQSLLSNAGSLVGYLFPFFFTWVGISNIAGPGVIPDSVIYSFYIGSAVLIVSVLYTGKKVKEMPPTEFEQFHDITIADKTKKTSLISLLTNAPRVFWTVSLVQFFCSASFIYMWAYTNGAIADTVWNTTNPHSEGYQAAGNWVGVLFAVQAVGSVIWATMLPLFKSRRFAYFLSLVLGGIGFLTVSFFTNRYMLFIPYLLSGCAWGATLALPFALLTNSVPSKHTGAYLGLFNCSVCIPQIIAALAGGFILRLAGGSQMNMLILAAILLIFGAFCVGLIKKPVSTQ